MTGKKSKRGALNKRIRETISGLPDEALTQILQNSPLNYTPFALRVAREELSKRKKMKSLRQDVEASQQTDGEAIEAGRVGSESASCYVEMWRDKNFEGDSLRIEGPAEYYTLKTEDRSWGDVICSLRVGPNAFVIVYEDRDFGGEMICFGPCQEVADLSEFGFDNEIESVKLINSVKIFEYVRLVGE